MKRKNEFSSVSSPNCSSVSSLSSGYQTDDECGPYLTNTRDPTVDSRSTTQIEPIKKQRPKKSVAENFHYMKTSTNTSHTNISFARANSSQNQSKKSESYDESYAALNEDLENDCDEMDKFELSSQDYLDVFTNEYDKSPTFDTSECGFLDIKQDVEHHHDFPAVSKIRKTNFLGQDTSKSKKIQIIMNSRSILSPKKPSKKLQAHEFMTAKAKSYVVDNDYSYQRVKEFQDNSNCELNSSTDYLDNFFVNKTNISSKENSNIFIGSKPKPLCYDNTSNDALKAHCDTYIKTILKEKSQPHCVDGGSQLFSDEIKPRSHSDSIYNKYTINEEPHQSFDAETMIPETQQPFCGIELNDSDLEAFRDESTSFLKDDDVSNIFFSTFAFKNSPCTDGADFSIDRLPNTHGISDNFVSDPFTNPPNNGANFVTNRGAFTPDADHHFRNQMLVDPNLFDESSNLDNTNEYSLSIDTLFDSEEYLHSDFESNSSIADQSRGSTLDDNSRTPVLLNFLATTDRLQAKLGSDYIFNSLDKKNRKI